MINQRPITTLTLTTLLVTGCGWVDSTGTQGERGATLPSSPEAVLVNEGAVVLNEASASRFILTNAPRSTAGWIWQEDNQLDALSVCQQQNGFDAEVATQSLSQACVDSSTCELSIQEVFNNNETVFELVLPELNAPVALGYSIETTLSSGDVYRHSQSVCGVAINEAPEINADNFLALSDTTRIVNSGDLFGVFANDIDDIHIRNQPLFIKEVTQAPEFAETINVLATGGFRYTPRSDLNIPNNSSLTDSIGVVISDGVHDVSSSINIKIVNFNSAPFLSSNIPDFVFTVDGTEEEPVSISLANFFEDSDNDSLQFHLSSNSLTESGALSFSETGLLTGTVSADAIGSEQLTITASDGLFQTSNSFSITVRDRQPNQPPSVTDIKNLRVSGAFSYDVAQFFSDADGDALTFSSTNLPPNTELTPDGNLTGTASNQNDGRWLIRIVASDSRGGTVDDQFRLTIID